MQWKPVKLKISIAFSLDICYTKRKMQVFLSFAQEHIYETIEK